MTSAERHTGILLEQLLDEVRTIHELVADQPTRTEFRKVQDDIEIIKADLQVMKLVQVDTSRQVNTHE